LTHLAAVTSDLPQHSGFAERSLSTEKAIIEGTDALSHNSVEPAHLLNHPVAHPLTLVREWSQRQGARHAHQREAKDSITKATTLLGFTLAAYNLDRIRGFRAKRRVGTWNQLIPTAAEPLRPNRTGRCAKSTALARAHQQLKR
jgi:hypothetical protein